VGALGLVCFLNMENTGRRFCRAGGELRGAGDEGGLDRDASSEKMAGESFGLDVGGVQVSRGGAQLSSVEETVGAFTMSTLVFSTVDSTRLRLVGGSSS
jgi:hypothetical protein